jgi:hypothetical protein
MDFHSLMFDAAVLVEVAILVGVL